MSVANHLEKTLLARKKNSDAPVIWREYSNSLDDPKHLAEMVRGWRGYLDITADVAATLLGISVRTLNGIEQGRGFRYPLMLMQAMTAIDHDVQNHRASHGAAK